MLVNDDLQRTFDDLLAILTAERRKAPRLKEGISAFVDQLLSES